MQESVLVNRLWQLAEKPSITNISFFLEVFECFE